MICLIFVLLAKLNSGDLHCPVTALIIIWKLSPNTHSVNCFLFFYKIVHVCFSEIHLVRMKSIENYSDILVWMKLWNRGENGHLVGVLQTLVLPSPLSVSHLLMVQQILHKMVSAFMMPRLSFRDTGSDASGMD